MLNEGMSTEEVLNKSKSITACNLFKNGKLMYKPYRTAKIGSKRIGIIGVGYPSPNGAGSYSDGEWKFNEYTILDDVKLFNQVQKYIIELKVNNFDYIVVVSHMCKSSYESDSRYVARTDSLIKNTSGLTAVLQGHYNFATNAESITDKSGRAVLLAHESGSNMNSFGRLQLKPGRTTSYLLDERSDLNVI
jgi:2',3'-cyclic-nucleotide 2'-phosphodiesterase (5'-nucleotidase family)